MTSLGSTYSPYIEIYLAIGDKRIRLADVLSNTATLFDHETVPAGTLASLVFSINGKEQRQEVLLHEGITGESEIISFRYRDDLNNCDLRPLSEFGGADI